MLLFKKMWCSSLPPSFTRWYVKWFRWIVDWDLCWDVLWWLQVTKQSADTLSLADDIYIEENYVYCSKGATDSQSWRCVFCCLVTKVFFHQIHVSYANWCRLSNLLVVSKQLRSSCLETWESCDITTKLNMFIIDVQYLLIAPTGEGLIVFQHLAWILDIAAISENRSSFNGLIKHNLSISFIQWKTILKHGTPRSGRSCERLATMTRLVRCRYFDVTLPLFVSQSLFFCQRYDTELNCTICFLSLKNPSHISIFIYRIFTNIDP